MLYGFNDVVLNYNMLEHAHKFLIHARMKQYPINCYLSPFYTPDYVLKEYPKITFGICGLDLTHEKNFIFASRILSNIKNKKNVEIKFFTDMCHGALDVRDFGFDCASEYYEKTVEIMKNFLKE